jgi:4,5-dihydroxyphthalate decarboxylase
MSHLRLTMALAEYDHMLDLSRGRITPAGIDLLHLELPIELIFERFLRLREWHVSEMSLAKFSSLVATGEDWMVGLPVFPLRAFRHSAIYVHRDSSLTDPAELAGLRVGIPEWAQTAGVYLRGLLAEQYGVPLGSVDWVQAGVNEPGRKEKVPFVLPDGVSYRPAPTRSLNEMLLTRELDAVLSAHPPAGFLADQGIRRLIAEPRDAERRSWRETGVFPIMHVVVVRRDVVVENAWVPMALYSAFQRAKELSLARATNITVPTSPLPWLAEDARALVAELGDPAPYGIEANRPTLEAFLRFAHGQGLHPRLLSPEELFTAEVENSYRV